LVVINKNKANEKVKISLSQFYSANKLVSLVDCSIYNLNDNNSEIAFGGMSYDILKIVSLSN